MSPTPNPNPRPRLSSCPELAHHADLCHIELRNLSSTYSSIGHASCLLCDQGRSTLTLQHPRIRRIYISTIVQQRPTLFTVNSLCLFNPFQRIENHDERASRSRVELVRISQRAGREPPHLSDTQQYRILTGSLISNSPTRQLSTKTTQLGGPEGC